MRNMRRRFVRKSGGRGPSREWISLQPNWQISAATATGAVSLMSLQQPTSLSLTSDPPEDMTLLRIKGSFSMSMLGIGNWTLAMLVQDTTWSPSTLLTDDADKRLLWLATFANTLATGKIWNPDGTVEYGSGGVSYCDMMTHVDITPKVRLEAGKALYLVAYENSGATTVTALSTDMRLLFQRSGRR